MDLNEPQLTADRQLRHELREDKEDRAVWILAEARHEALKALRGSKDNEEAQGWRDYIDRLAKEIVDQAEQELVALEAEDRELERRTDDLKKELTDALGQLTVALQTKPVAVITALVVVLLPLGVGFFFAWKLIVSAVAWLF